LLDASDHRSGRPKLLDQELRLEYVKA